MRTFFLSCAINPKRKCVQTNTTNDFLSLLRKIFLDDLRRIINFSFKKNICICVYLEYLTYIFCKSRRQQLKIDIEGIQHPALRRLLCFPLSMLHLNSKVYTCIFIIKSMYKRCSGNIQTCMMFVELFCKT